ARGQLPVFRPPLDRGVDALVHRLTDGAYIPVQAKGRSSLRKGTVQLLVAAESVEGGVGPKLLVVPTPDFRRLALLTNANGVPEYSMSFSMNPRSKDRWQAWLVASGQLVERFGVALGLPAARISAGPPWLRSSPLG